MEIVEMTFEKAREIIEAQEPAGVFYYVNKAESFVGVDARRDKRTVRIFPKKEWLMKWYREVV